MCGRTGGCVQTHTHIHCGQGGICEREQSCVLRVPQKTTKVSGASRTFAPYTYRVARLAATELLRDYYIIRTMILHES